MFDNVNLSKFRVPAKQKGFLQRARLIDWMHENIHRKLTFISAPAGFGKTSLLLDFASDVEARVCWFLLTQGDLDLGQFAWGLLLSLRQSFPDFGREIETFLRTNSGGFDHVSLANDFITEAIHHIDDYCLLFVDDYHLVADSDEVTGFFELLLDYLPDGIRIVAASRTEFGIPTGKLYTRNQINLMNVDQLRFRPDELQQLIAKAYRIKLSDEEAAELTRRSDGWIVAVMLAANSMKWGQYLEFKGSAEHVYSFLAQEVIERESEELQQFMLAVSIVDEFNEEIAGALFPSGDTRELILQLELRNLFVSRVETQAGSAYRFHQLFLEFLRHRLEASNYSMEMALHQRAAEWYEIKRDWDNAIQHYLQIGERAAAAKLMDLVAKNHFVFGANVRVENWLNILSGPPDLRASAPELLLNRSKYLVDQNRLAEAEQLLGIADEVFEKTRETDKVLNSLSVRGLIFWRRGDYDAVRSVVAAARKIMAGSISGALYPARAQQFDRMESLCDLSLGNLEVGAPGLNKTIDQQRKILEQVDNYVTKTQIVHDVVLSYETLAFFMYQEGRLYESQGYFLEAFHLRDKHLRKNQGLIFSLNNIGYIYYQLGDFKKAFSYLKHALELLETVEQGQASIHLHNSYADLMCDLDEWDEAESFLDTAIQFGEDAAVKKKTLDNTGTYLSYMGLERVRGNYDKAIFYLHESFRLNKSSLDSPNFRANLGAIYFSMGQIDLAIETLGKADSGFEKSNNVSKQHALTDYLLGCAHFQKGEFEKSKTFLESAFNQTAKMGYDHFLIAEGRRTLPFLDFVREELPGLAQIQSVVKRIEDYKTGLASIEDHSEAQEPTQEAVRLEISGFGMGKVLINGKTVHKRDWRANMAKSLFYYILDRQGVSGAAIKLAFWPEKSGAKATSNFQSTLWRARKALKGLNILVLEDNQYLISKDIQIWYDVHEFEDLVKQAAQPGISESEEINLLQSAVEMVAGEFLEDIFMEWANERRLQLQRTLQQVLEKLGELLYKRARYEKAIEYFEKLLEIDPYRDDVQLSLLKCLNARGFSTQASSRYKSYAEFLHKEGLVPSPDLTAYMKKMDQGKD